MSALYTAALDSLEFSDTFARLEVIGTVAEYVSPIILSLGGLMTDDLEEADASINLTPADARLLAMHLVEAAQAAEAAAAALTAEQQYAEALVRG